jgi:hypothetical protein
LIASSYDNAPMWNAEPRNMYRIDQAGPEA